MHKEIELKVLEIDVKEIQRKLVQLGAKKVEDCIIRDRIFDFSDRRIEKKGDVLRVRQQGNKTVLTYKAGTKKKSEFKEADEHETCVDDFDTVCSVLKHLGLEAWIRIEKRRISYIHGKTKIEIDKYPTIPAYLEIEGSKEAIMNVLKKLGYTMKDTTTMSSTYVLKHYKQDFTKQEFEK